ncbi:Uncharacterized protein OBRU01_09886 [Operophtera brumata]|uniref:Uncharacterized protein n=1 Tax=Operophtera brumata TaxID=104452 RepID=A0A0L7KZ13_OPEBR|nr:Uncharacterized protein OBRU01_09886 [Operophtera brumata]
MSACSGWAPVSFMSHLFTARREGTVACALGWGLDSKVKRFVEGGGGVKNVYCLSLPPYSGEEHDPIHGSLLLVDGKLTALYLQEERRSQGVQSAQYTGIWRLISWVMEVATEPEIELLAIDI